MSQECVQPTPSWQTEIGGGQMNVLDGGSRTAEYLGRRIAEWRFVPPVDYWAGRIWDGDGFEAASGDLARAYQSEREIIRSSLEDYVTHTRGRRLFALDAACGTGRYTRLLLDLGVEHVTSVDVSTASLELLRGRTRDAERVSCVLQDVRLLGAVPDPPTYDIVLCCDAIHHLGDLTEVLHLLRRMAKPGGLIVGDVWTSDNYAELQAERRGATKRFSSSMHFLMAALLNGLANRSVMSASRSQLHTACETERLLRQAFPEVLVRQEKFWVSFSTIAEAPSP